MLSHADNIYLCICICISNVSIQISCSSSASMDVASIAIEYHYRDVIMGAIAFQITSLTIVYSTVYSGAEFRVTGLCVGNSPVTGEFPAQMASNAEKGTI